MSDTKTLKARTIELSKSARSLATDIQVHLNDILDHVLQHKDVSLYTHLVTTFEMKDKTGNSFSIVRVNAIKTWISKHGCAKFGKTKDGKQGYTLDGKLHADLSADADKMAAHRKVAKATAWNKTIKETTLADFDLDKALKQLLKRVDDAIVNRDEDGKPRYKTVNINDARLAALRAVMN